MLFLFGTLGSTDDSIRLPCVHYYPPNMHYVRIIYVRGHRTSCYRRESEPLVRATLERKTRWMVEVVEILSLRLVERLED